MRWVYSCLLLLIVGCRSGGDKRPDVDPQPVPEPHWLEVWVDSITIDQIMRASGLGFAALAPLLVVSSVILVIMKMPRMAVTAISLVPVAIAAGILFMWLGENITWVRLLVLVPVFILSVIWGWKKFIPSIEKHLGIDINRDGIIGGQHDPNHAEDHTEATRIS